MLIYIKTPMRSLLIVLVDFCEEIFNNQCLSSPLLMNNPLFSSDLLEFLSQSTLVLDMVMCLHSVGSEGSFALQTPMWTNLWRSF